MAIHLSIRHCLNVNMTCNTANSSCFDLFQVFWNQVNWAFWGTKKLSISLTQLEPQLLLINIILLDHEVSSVIKTDPPDGDIRKVGPTESALWLLHALNVLCHKPCYISSRLLMSSSTFAVYGHSTTFYCLLRPIVLECEGNSD